MSLPFEFREPIRTERLALRLMTVADVDDVHAYQGREDVCLYLLHEPRTRDEIERHVAKCAAATTLAADGDWIEPAIELDGRVIGHMYVNLSSVEHLGGEIGWTLHPDFFGQGYATEASRAILDLAFGELGLHRMHAELDPRNDASIALCHRLGMREEAHFVKDMLVKGVWDDTGVYAVLAEEWAAGRLPEGPPPDAADPGALGSVAP
ncbi:MAG: GNAT family protein [Pseudolysinimonas sp.]